MPCRIASRSRADGCHTRARWRYPRCRSGPGTGLRPHRRTPPGGLAGVTYALSAVHTATSPRSQSSTGTILFGSQWCSPEAWTESRYSPTGTRRNILCWPSRRTSWRRVRESGVTFMGISFPPSAHSLYSGARSEIVSSDMEQSQTPDQLQSMVGDGRQFRQGTVAGRWTERLAEAPLRGPAASAPRGPHPGHPYLLELTRAKLRRFDGYRIVASGRRCRHGTGSRFAGVTFPYLMRRS